MIAVLIVLAAAALFFLTTRTVDRIYGGATRIVDPGQFQVENEPIAIIDVSVLSPDGSQMLADRTVLVRDGQIVSISAGDDIPQGVTRIDGRGKFLIPGLMDSHVHLQRSPNDLLLYVANGVTQIRSMGGSASDLALRDEIRNGRIGPRFHVSSPSMNSVDGFWSAGSAPGWIPEPLVIWFVESVFNTHATANAQEARDDARAFIDRGHDGIKLYGFLTMDSYRAILDVAEELNVPTVGHLPDSMPLNELRTTKLREIAHIEELVKALLNEFGSFKSQGSGAFIAFVESRKDEIAADLNESDIAVHSTLRFSENLADQVFDLDALIADTPLEYANPGIVEGYAPLGFGWLPGSNKFEAYAGDTPGQIASNREFWAAREEAHRILLRAMVDAGVTILAGTDANGWMSVPGFSLHDELQSLNGAGMTAAQALHAATAAPARIMDSDAGVIDVGRRADLVLLNENPLVDIENTSAIDAVVLNGRYLNRGALDAILEAVKAANTAS
ncbi:amidohydrolase family protein [Brevundimonas sp. R86498]|uniref:amidohydrolase family protein n=1 Tax=Brevundimonas sp. R86498 TaxID=3093845 RepID=UPI0037CA61E2